jgi:glutamate-ammonia-ligase adenylyltransferase
MARWRATARRVNEAFAAFFSPGADACERPLDAAAQAARLVLAAAPERDALPLLEPFGLATPGALKILRRLGGLGPEIYLTQETRELYARLLPLLIAQSRENPRPAVALANLESFLAAAGAMAGFYRIFLETPIVFRLLMHAFGSGDVLARTLIAHPEFLDYLYHPELLTAEADEAGTLARLEAWTARAADDTAFSAALASFRRLEFLLAGLGELAGLIDYIPSCARVTATARAIIAASLARAAGRLGLARETPHFAIMALGRLGAGEMTYQSDLDLIFVWEEGFAPDGRSPAETAAALAEQVIALLSLSTPEGAPFRIDTRLRPEGQNAPLAPPLARYLDYYAARAQPWEWQSALKLRPVAGDFELGTRMARATGRTIALRIEEARAAAANGAAASLAATPLAREVRAMRQRIEQALKTPRWAFCDLKGGPGGTFDLEFIAQFLQLRHLAADPELLGLGTIAVFERLGRDGRLEPELAEGMRADYIWLRRLERRARLLQDTAKSLLPDHGEKLTALERACGPLLAEQPAASLKDAAAAVLRRNRTHFDRLVRDE